MYDTRSKHRVDDTEATKTNQQIRTYNYCLIVSSGCSEYNMATNYLYPQRWSEGLGVGGTKMHRMFAK